MHRAIEIFVGKLEGKQPLGRFNRKFQDNIENETQRIRKR